VQIRRLNFKRDSLEDIFLKAMENGDDANTEQKSFINETTDSHR